MGDAGDGDLLQRQHGDDAAANVQKGPEGGQMGHFRGDHGPRPQVGEEILHSPLLDLPAGEKGNRRTFFIGADSFNCKAN